MLELYGNDLSGEGSWPSTEGKQYITFINKLITSTDNYHYFMNIDKSQDQSGERTYLVWSRSLG